MTDERDAKAAEALLEAFRLEVPPRPERPPTFMEISGYPHYENVCSNILAFFFNPSEPHGFGTLFLDALAQVGGIEDPDGTIGVNVQVDREESTLAGNRIDLLILSDSHVVLIENKVFARPDYNPYMDYSRHVCTLPQRHKYKFLLTLKPVRVGANSNIEHGFRNITYAQLVQKVRGLLGQYVSRADTRYLTFILDFMNTLEYLQGGMNMNPELVDFLAKQSNEVDDFLKQIKWFKDEMRAKIKRLEEMIDVRTYTNVRQWKYREAWLFDILVHDITIGSEFVVAVDTKITPSGWTVQIFPRRENSENRLKLKEILRNLDIHFEDRDRLTLPTQFKYGVELHEVCAVVCDTVHRLATRKADH